MGKVNNYTSLMWTKKLSTENTTTILPSNEPI